jgi:hypothetical protein
LGLGDPLQTGGIGEREGKQFVVALEQMRDRPRGDGHPAVAQVLIDCGQAPVLRIAEGTDARNDIAAKFMLG